MKRPVIVLLHTGYWVMYLLVLFFILLAVTANSNIYQLRGFYYLMQDLFFSPFALFTLGTGLSGFYFFYFVLFPKFLNRGKILALILYGIASSLIASVLIQFIMYAVFMPRIMVSGEWDSIAGVTITMAFIVLVHGTIALVMRGFISWYGDIKLKEELNRKNYEMELALIRSQVNPHFLFNTINNIDVLIESDAPRASAYLNKLSDIMRFMLYETKAGRTPLSKELAYIEKYIDLQKIRTSNTSYVSYTVKGDEEGNTLAEPMLFIPFIENAFKHSSNKKIENAIRISFDISKYRIVFDCENHYEKYEAPVPDHSGLGNELIRKRLMLLYPGRHTLDITEANGVYKVHLEIET
jgi:two-component system, LytTR family, sensor kinase